MSDRPLTAGEKALWQKFIETVEPLDRAPISQARSLPVSKDTVPPSTVRTEPSRDRQVTKKLAPEFAQEQRATAAKTGLDGHWDRRLAKGAVQPDVTVDLHGHSLASAHGRLDSALELSIAAGHRAILLIAGRARNHDRASGRGRGAIRAALGDWLHHSRHAAHIAAVRRAHPRHGGGGALYIILKRKR